MGSAVLVEMASVGAQWTLSPAHGNALSHNKQRLFNSQWDESIYENAFLTGENNVLSV